MPEQRRRLSAHFRAEAVHMVACDHRRPVRAPSRSAAHLTEVDRTAAYQLRSVGESVFTTRLVGLTRWDPVTGLGTPIAAALLSLLVARTS